MRQPLSPAWAALVWALAWAGMWALDGSVDLANLAMLLVLASALAALCLPVWASALLSAAAVLGFNWVFVPPRGTFSVDLRQHALLLGGMLLLSWIVAALVATQRRLALQAEAQAQQAEQLRDLGEALRDADEPFTQAGLLTQALAELCEGPVRLLMLKDDLPAENDAAAAWWLGAPDADQMAGLWLCLRQTTAFGPGTGRHEELAEWYLPMRGRAGSWGAAALPLAGADEFDPAQRAHAQSLCDQMGLALQRAHTLRAAAQAREQAQTQAVRNALLAAISHDYRTPLATIMGAASSLQTQADRLSSEQQGRLASSIVAEATQLSRLTDNTLQLARLDAPGVQLRCDWESAEELVGAVMQRARLRTSTRRLSARLEPGLPLLHCDAVLLTQMLDNLLDNALKYSGPDSPVELLVRQQAGQVVLAVRDRGPGVAPAWRERIFDVFQRGSADLGVTLQARKDAAAQRGAGVGLAVCRAIARAHGGELKLRARGHGGSSFECVLPVLPPPAPPPEAPT